jgi:DNA-directed RNA polymerase alpha subunit
MRPPHRKYRKPVKTGLDTSTWTPAEREAQLKKQRLETPVAEMQLPVRVINTLEENGVILACDLIKETYESMMKMKNFGDKTMSEVKAALAALGLEAPATWTKPPKVRLTRTPKRNKDPFGDW